MKNNQTIIHSNGSRWMGEELATIEELIEVLGTQALDEAHFDGFIHQNTVGAEEDGSWIRVPGIYFFGNFAEVSHVLSIESTDPVVVACLTRAIVSNVCRQHPKIDRGCACSPYAWSPELAKDMCPLHGASR